MEGRERRSRSAVLKNAKNTRTTKHRADGRGDTNLNRAHRFRPCTCPHVRQCERSFAELKLLETSLRSRMKTEQLHGASGHRTKADDFRSCGRGDRATQDMKDTRLDLRMNQSLF